MIVHSMILFLAAVLFLALGIAVYKGNTNLIHDYHRTNVKESERTEYGRAFAKGMFAIGATLLISGMMALFGQEGLMVTGSLIVLLAGLIVSIVVMVKVQKKYNGGMF